MDLKGIHELLDHFGIYGLPGFLAVVFAIGMVAVICIVLIKSVPAGWLGRRWSNTQPCSVKKSKRINKFMLDKVEIEALTVDALHRLRQKILADSIVFFPLTNGDFSFDKQICFDFLTPTYESVDNTYPSVLHTNKIKLSGVPNIARRMFSSCNLVSVPDIAVSQMPDMVEFSRLGAKSIIIAPIRSRGQVVGAMTCAWIGCKVDSFTQEQADAIRDAQIEVGTQIANLQLLCREKG
jgi:hypothetical protein